MAVNAPRPKHLRMITALKNRLRALAFGLLALGLVGAAPTIASAQDAASSQTAWRLLDYLAVDYSGAVQNGQIISPPEYAEMNEFAAQVRERIAALPVHPAQPGLVSKARALEAAIIAKQDPTAVAGQAHALAAELLVAYPTPLAPVRTPDLPRGAALFPEIHRS